MFLLPNDVPHHRSEIPLGKADDTKSSLPSQCIVTIHPVHFERARPLELADNIARGQGRLNLYHQMYMSRSSTNCLQINAALLPAILPNDFVQRRLPSFLNQRLIALAMPDEVKVNRMENMTGHPLRTSAFANTGTKLIAEMRSHPSLRALQRPFLARAGLQAGGQSEHKKTHAQRCER